MTARQRRVTGAVVAAILLPYLLACPACLPACDGGPAARRAVPDIVPVPAPQGADAAGK